MTEMNYDEVFATMGSLIGVIPFVVEFFKKLIPNAKPLVVQLFSWLIGIALTMIGFAFNLGFLADLVWWQALIAGTLVSLGANGIFDTGLITWIFSLFKKKVKKETEQTTTSEQ